MSPAPAAPRIASVTAWQTTSASECPSAPRSAGIVTPPRTSGRPRRAGAGRSRCRPVATPPDGCTRARARARSAAVVIFTFAASPSTTCTRCPARSASVASSVAVDAGSAQRDRRRQHLAAERLRRLRQIDLLARDRLDDHGVAVARRASPCRSPAPRRSPRRARRAASIARAIRSAVTNGRAASWTSTMSRSAATRVERVRHRILPPLAAGHQPHRRARRRATIGGRRQRRRPAPRR